jgi:hypothetical protein
MRVDLASPHVPPRSSDRRGILVRYRFVVGRRRPCGTICGTSCEVFQHPLNRGQLRVRQCINSSWIARRSMIVPRFRVQYETAEPRPR